MSTRYERMRKHLDDKRLTEEWMRRAEAEKVTPDEVLDEELRVANLARRYEDGLKGLGKSPDAENERLERIEEEVEAEEEP